MRCATRQRRRFGVRGKAASRCATCYRRPGVRLKAVTGGIVCLPVCAAAHNPAFVLQVLLGANTIDSKRELANKITVS